MGIRINKILGYGLADVGYDSESGEINDPRIHADALNSQNNFSDINYLEYLSQIVDKKKQDSVELLPYKDESLMDIIVEKDITELSLAKVPSYEKYAIKNGIHYNSESGLPNVLVIVPPTLTQSWVRRDDAIDYAESMETGGIEPSIKKLYHPMYPHDGWMNSLTGGNITGKAYESMRHIKAIESAFKEKSVSIKDVQRSYEIVERLAVEAGFSSYDEYSRSCAPMIPYGVSLLAEWLNIFTNSNTLNELRPMVYTYWS